MIAFVVFIGIVIWAFSSRRKSDFEKAGRMAMDDDKPLKESEMRKGGGSNMNHSNLSAAGNNGSNIEE